MVEGVLKPGHYTSKLPPGPLGTLTQGLRRPHDSATLQDKPETLADNPVGFYLLDVPPEAPDRWEQANCQLQTDSQQTSHTGPEMNLPRGDQLLTPSQ